MRVLLLSMPDSFEHTPALTMRMPNGALASLAGNVGGELLNWIAMLAFTESRKPDFLIKQMENGHAYAGWRWS